MTFDGVSELFRRIEAEYGQRHAERRRGNTDVPFCGNCRLGEEYQDYKHDHCGNRGIIYQRQLQTDIISKKPEIFCLLKIPRIEVFARCTVLDESGDRKRRKNGEYYGIRDPRAAEEKPENKESKINCGKRKRYLGQPFLYQHERSCLAPEHDHFRQAPAKKRINKRRNVSDDIKSRPEPHRLDPVGQARIRLVYRPGNLL